MTREKSPLEWREEYSVGVALIDRQHQEMFRMINELVGIINVGPNRERIDPVLSGLVEYKEKHFATEEGYFRRFKFEGAEEHIAEHRKFNETMDRIKGKWGDDMIGFTFELIDFLEDWLLDHILNTDRKYIECFHANGLK
jgi:hemerythrin-like metal-binding protein